MFVLSGGIYLDKIYNGPRIGASVDFELSNMWSGKNNQK